MLVFLVARLFSPKQTNPTAECDGDPAQAPEANDVSDPSPESSKVTSQHRNTATAEQQQHEQRQEPPPA
jgi:hypothetical protein